MNVHEIKKAILAASNDALAGEPMVYQLWSDGELTLTKGGELLGQRRLHQIEPPILVNGTIHKEILKDMPHVESNGFGFIYCSDFDAYSIRSMLSEG